MRSEQLSYEFDVVPTKLRKVYFFSNGNNTDIFSDFE